MARKVFVSSDMAHDERLIEVAEVSPEAALLWPWFVTYFDDWGRAEAHPKRIKARLFPMNDLVTPELIEQAVAAFADVGLIITYEVAGKPYMAVPPENWWKYQTHIHRSKRDDDRSKYPAPPLPEDRDTPRDSAEVREGARVFVPSPSSLPPFHPSPTEDEDTRARASDEDAEWRELTLAVVGATYDRYVAEELDQDVADIGLDAVKEAMRRAVAHATSNRLAYYRKIVGGWRGKVKNLDDVRRLDEAARPPARDPPRRPSALELAAQAKGGLAQ